MRLKSAKTLVNKRTYIYINALDITTYTDKESIGYNKYQDRSDIINHILNTYPNWFSIQDKHKLNKDSSIVILDSDQALAYIQDKDKIVYEPKYIIQLNQPVRDANGRAIGERTHFMTNQECIDYYDQLEQEYDEDEE